MRIEQLLLNRFHEDQNEAFIIRFRGKIVLM